MNFDFLKRRCKSKHSLPSKILRKECLVAINIFAQNFIKLCLIPIHSKIKCKFIHPCIGILYICILVYVFRTFIPTYIITTGIKAHFNLRNLNDLIYIVLLT